MNQNAPILHIDDDPVFTRLAGAHLRERVGDIVALNDATQWQATLERLESWIVLLDIDLPGVDGVELLSKIRQLDGDRRVIVVTGTPSMNVVLTSMSQGADFIFYKHDLAFNSLIDAIVSVRFRRFHWERAAAVATRCRQKNAELTRSVENEFSLFRKEHAVEVSADAKGLASLFASTSALDSFGEYLVKRGAVPHGAIGKALEYSMRRTPLLGQIAVSERFLTMKQVFTILEDQAVSQGRFGEVAIRLGMLDSKRVAALLARQKEMQMRLDEALVAVGAIAADDMRRFSEAFRYDELYAPQAAV